MTGPLGPGTVNSFSMESLCFPRFSWDCRETKFVVSPRDQSLTVKYSTPDIGNDDIVIIGLAWGQAQDQAKIEVNS